MATSRIDLLLGFIRQKPGDPFPRYGLAMEYKNTSRLEDAWQIFDELMTTSPDYTAAYLHAGNVLVAMGRIEDARAVYGRGIAACVRRGDTHARGELEGALGALG